MSRKKNYEKLLEKSINAALCAIDLYNRTFSAYKEEAFAILMTNAWELLLKSRWIYDNGNNIKSLYIKVDKKRYKKNRSGNYMTYGIDYLLKKFYQHKKISKNVHDNIIGLIEIRDNAVHFKLSPTTRKKAHNIYVASIRNFKLLIKKWFGEKYESKLTNNIINPISLTFDEESIFYNLNEKNLYRFLHQLSAHQEDDKEGFYISVDVEIKFVKSDDIEGAIPVKHEPGNPNAQPLRLTEEQWLKRYPWTYKTLISKLKERYKDFKVNKKFHELKKDIEPDQKDCKPDSCYNKYCRIRFLDPQRPNKSPKKKFYSPEVLKYFDKYYSKKLKDKV